MTQVPGDDLRRHVPLEEKQSDSSPTPLESGHDDLDSRSVRAGEDKSQMQSGNSGQETKTVQQEQAKAIDPPDSDDVLAKPGASHEDKDAAVLAESRRQTRRAFIVAGAATAAGVAFYKWLDLEPSQDMQPGVLRRALQTNAFLSREITGNHVLTPTYPLSRAENLRVNGLYGLKMELIPDSWRLQLVGSRTPQAHPRFTKDVTAWEYRYTKVKNEEDQGHDTKIDPGKKEQKGDTKNEGSDGSKQDATKRGVDQKPGEKSDPSMNTAGKMAPASMMKKAEEDENHTGRKPRGMEEAGESDSTLAPHTPGLLLTMDDILKFPRQELVTQFKCIEGWSQIVHWAGIRLADFLEAYPPELVDGKEPKYVYMETPDGDYYNGYDLDVCRHPQTLLVTDMMGAPLTQFHGAPLRLHMPTKYGYKQIKRIGLISYINDKPDDYWTKLGYDWYAGL